VNGFLRKKKAPSRELLLTAWGFFYFWAAHWALKRLSIACPKIVLDGLCRVISGYVFWFLVS